MAVDAASGAAATNTGVSATGRERLVESFDTFLNLLTAQIKNQDPLSPMDSTQFTQQLVQMTGVEQQLLTNDLLEKLVTNTGSGIQTAVSLIGREVRAVSSDAKLAAGKAEWNYKLDRAASDVTVEVLDSNGKVVQVVKPTDNGAGDHKFSWNGKDRTGAQLPNGGTYTLRVTAKDGTGATVPSTAFVTGVVTGVEQVDGQTLITVNGVRIGWEKVTSIKQPEEPVETASTDTPTTSNPDDDTSPSALAA
ncbi:flagellar hook assembly protein FlgD [Phenylobacterium sp.]|uniref:flagellar hook assembly protein FlgD n=1 Tax=Phenylobacterium sp. TaxID=1871053 RepID=UPI002736BB11|nr:flagellar hook assembly protein FlgD [Phenylobacterium sp.]MDP3855276.1 flagellar hook assembly protein FlgD [Phenylobacterium sp.]